ncbi:hypothetical protein [uncultured Desulfovibrio sp.]|uniref:hypothetical protein n=1 Tax=uncultured Desulfovibrio sp. TaxID=167968 RepID=UPI00261A43D9|nr:hypothetical protein [uncultured Desulfovibrio sp.]
MPQTALRNNAGAVGHTVQAFPSSQPDLRSPEARACRRLIRPLVGAVFVNDLAGLLAFKTGELLHSWEGGAASAGKMLTLFFFILVFIYIFHRRHPAYRQDHRQDLSLFHHPAAVHGLQSAGGPAGQPRLQHSAPSAPGRFFHQYASQGRAPLAVLLFLLGIYFAAGGFTAIWMAFG